MSSPIRVALIGLGPTASPYYTPGEWGIQHLNAILNSPHYELVAVCNSTVESAKRSIASHGLASTVKAYGSSLEVARDPEVDLVAVAVNIDRHYELVKPLLEHKKNVVVEFPFTPTIAQTEELLALAKPGGVKNIVASQGRADPAVRKLKEIVQNNTIGDILFTSFSGQNQWGTPDMWPQAQQKFLDVDAGISRVNIILGHPLDAFIHVLGGFSSIQSVFKTVKESTKLVDGQGNVVDADYKVTAPEHMLLQGVLKSGAAASFTIRTTPVAADGPAYRWTITGTEGEVMFTSGSGTFQMNPPDAKIYLKKGDADVQEVDFSRDEGEYVAKSGAMGTNVARVYEAYARGDTEGLSTIEQTLETEKVLHQLKKAAVWASPAGKTTTA